MKTTHYDGITKGKLNNPDAFREKLQRYEAKRISIVISDEKRRSNDQNAYIHAVVFPLIKDYVNEHREENKPEVDIDDIKDSIQYKGTWGYKEVDGVFIPKRSSEATTEEMVKGIDKLQREWAVLGLDIPSPNEEDFRIGKEYEPPDPNQENIL